MVGENRGNTTKGPTMKELAFNTSRNNSNKDQKLNFCAQPKKSAIMMRESSRQEEHPNPMINNAARIKSPKANKEQS